MSERLIEKNTFIDTSLGKICLNQSEKLLVRRRDVARQDRLELGN